MSKRPTSPVDREALSLELYHGRRLKTVATVGERAGGFSFFYWLKGLLGLESACSTLAVIEAPMESGILSPKEMLPLLAGFSKSYSLEIFKDRAQNIHFQIGFQDKDTPCIHDLRGLFGASLNVRTETLEAWNAASGLCTDDSVAYLLPQSGLYPLTFALGWKDADVVALILETLKSVSSAPLLLQLLVEPQEQSGRKTATEVLASANGLTRNVEGFRQNLIRERFGQSLALFALRLLGTDESLLATLVRCLSVLDAPFNRFRRVPLSGRQSKQVAQAMLERHVGLFDGLSWISLPELAGLWHLPWQPDFTIERARVREVATARLTGTHEAGRIFGFHTLRGKTAPVVLPYAARNNHVSVFGRSQSGKTTAMLRIGAGDIHHGLGVAFVDQHDLAQRLLPHVPRERWDDVVLISPRLAVQTGRVFPLNLFDIGRADAYAVEFVCETLKEILGRAFGAESIGPRSSFILDIAVTALLKDPQPGAPHSVLDLSTVLLDKTYRNALADRVESVDADTAEKLRGFDRLPKDSFAAPLNKLQLFSRDSIRPMLAARENGFQRLRGERASFLDAKPIVLVDVSDIPHASAVAIGSIALALLQLEAFKRNPQHKNDLFNVYVDEAAAFLNMENADLITRTFQETAKFRLSLCLINQSYDTIPPTVRKSLSTNVAALMYFAMGIGSGDAKIAKAELHDLFSEEELNALPVGRAALRLGGEVFSLASPDFPTPQTNLTEELIAHALNKHGVTIEKKEAITEAEGRDNKPENPPTVRPSMQKSPNPTPRSSTPTKSVNLATLQGEAKKQAVLRLLAACGLVPLADLNEIFFPDSVAYGRQFLKKIANDGLTETVKQGKRLAYYLTNKGAKSLKGKRRYEPFTLPHERLLEHAAMTGAVGARLCNEAAKRGATITMQRETPWQSLRPDLLVSWTVGARSRLILVEADRATESVATFRKEKLELYDRALAAQQGKQEVRLLVVVPDKKRKLELQTAMKDYPELSLVTRLVILTDWPVNGTIFDE